MISAGHDPKIFPNYSRLPWTTGESIAGMAKVPSESKSPFSWADTPWMAAALLGAWGVFMGVEEFFLANTFMVLAGASCTVRLYRDNIQSEPRRNSAFVLGLAIIVAIVGVDIHLTAKKKDSSEAKAGEIPRLNKQIADLQGTIDKQNAKLNQSQGQSDQKLADISQENKDLRRSVEAKDSALIAIAKQQLDLSFVPAVDITHETGRIHIFNRGKTTIRIWGDKYGDENARMEATPMAIPPTGVYDLFRKNRRSSSWRRSEKMAKPEFHLSYTSQRKTARNTLCCVLSGK
jgi:hypothetical protein